jgi:hypothetical protein
MKLLYKAVWLISTLSCFAIASNLTPAERKNIQNKANADIRALQDLKAALAAKNATAAMAVLRQRPELIDQIDQKQLDQTQADIRAEQRAIIEAKRSNPRFYTDPGVYLGIAATVGLSAVALGTGISATKDVVDTVKKMKQMKDEGDLDTAQSLSDKLKLVQTKIGQERGQAAVDKLNAAAIDQLHQETIDQNFKVDELRAIVASKAPSVQQKEAAQERLKEYEAARIADDKQAVIKKYGDYSKDKTDMLIAERAHDLAAGKSKTEALKKTTLKEKGSLIEGLEKEVQSLNKVGTTEATLKQLAFQQNVSKTVDAIKEKPENAPEREFLPHLESGNSNYQLTALVALKEGNLSAVQADIKSKSDALIEQSGLKQGSLDALSQSKQDLEKDLKKAHEKTYPELTQAYNKNTSDLLTARATPSELATIGKGAVAAISGVAAMGTGAAVVKQVLDDEKRYKAALAGHDEEALKELSKILANKAERQKAEQQKAADADLEKLLAF